MTRRPIALILSTLVLLAVAGWHSTARAQTGGWTQCVARSPSSGALYVGEPMEGAERGKAAQYRAEFIKAGQAAGVAAGELNAQTAFCFFAPRQADLGPMVADLGKPCPSCSAPYRQAPIAWNIRDILPAEIATAQSHLAALVLSDPPPLPPPPPPVPTTPAGGAAAPVAPETPPPPPPERRPLASARWQTFLCGTEVRVSYAFEAPADSTVESAPFQGVVTAAGGISRPFDQPLTKAQAAAPGCASAQFFKIADLPEFSRDLPPRGDARLAALRQRLEEVSLQVAPPPPPPPPVVEPAPAPAQKGRAAKPVTVAKPPPAPPPAAPSTPVERPAPPARPSAPASAPAPAQAPVQAAGTADAASAQLNAEISRRNAETASRNAAAAADYEKRMADYKAAQEAFAASQAAYEKSNREHEAEVARAAKARADWEAKVKACNAGDRAACAP